MAIRNPNADEIIKDYDELQTEEINKVVDFIVEIGSNTSGNWEKWNSGKLIQYGSSNHSAPNGYNQSWGANYITPEFFWTYPIPFVGGRPITTVNPEFISGDTGWLRGGVGANVTRSASYLLIRPVVGNLPTNINFEWKAVGRWK